MAKLYSQEDQKWLPTIDPDLYTSLPGRDAEQAITTFFNQVCTLIFFTDC